MTKFGELVQETLTEGLKLNRTARKKLWARLHDVERLEVTDHGDSFVIDVDARTGRRTLDTVKLILKELGLTNAVSIEMGDSLILRFL